MVVLPGRSAMLVSVLLRPAKKVKLAAPVPHYGRGSNSLSLKQVIRFLPPFGTSAGFGLKGTSSNHGLPARFCISSLDYINQSDVFCARLTRMSGGICFPAERLCHASERRRKTFSGAGFHPRG
ncbi:hypothetical protein [Lihuaxuella thermophila]|uniref:hypothetical protein n=1 Tax=Lihuaxuella thermophila TaxID=1173111 RepID=UPI00111373EC|nr:hypothetical protein [Lihuaxuella thermophila]